LLAAEKSKVPFYVAGGALAVWAVIVSVGFGLRKADFPGNLLGQRTVLAITAVLVLGTVSMAVVTAGSPAKKGVASASSTSPASGAAPATPAPATPATTPSASTHPARHHRRSPAATTGTPAPPSSPARQGAASTIALVADPAGLLSFNTKQLSAKAGSVTITFTNAAALEHNVTVAEGGKVLGATPSFIGGSRTLTLTLKAGTYTFYCSVPGHRQGGMEGTLSVT
jgi:plastocyanin